MLVGENVAVDETLCEIFRTVVNKCLSRYSKGQIWRGWFYSTNHSYNYQHYTIIIVIGSCLVAMNWAQC